MGFGCWPLAIGCWLLAVGRWEGRQRQKQLSLRGAQRRRSLQLFRKCRELLCLHRNKYQPLSPVYLWKIATVAALLRDDGCFNGPRPGESGFHRGDQGGPLRFSLGFWLLAVGYWLLAAGKGASVKNSCHCEERSDAAVFNCLESAVNYFVYIVTSTNHSVLYTYGRSPQSLRSFAMTAVLTAQGPVRVPFIADQGGPSRFRLGFWLLAVGKGASVKNGCHCEERSDAAVFHVLDTLTNG